MFVRVKQKKLVNLALVLVAALMLNMVSVMADDLEGDDPAIKMSVVMFNALDAEGVNVIDDGQITQSEAAGIKRLSLKNAGITNLSGLQEFPDLETLDVSGNTIDDWSDLQFFPKLTNLTAKNTGLSNFTVFANYDKIKVFDVSNNSLIIDWSKLSEMVTLTNLNLSGTEFEDPSVLSTLGNLKVLNVSNTEVDNWSYLAGLTTLTNLDVSNTDFNNPALLLRMSGLKVLNLTGTDIADWSDVGRLTSLTSLTVNNTGIENDDFEELGDLVNLKKLYAKNNDLDNISMLDDFLPNLTKVNLKNNDIRDIRPLAEMHELVSINILKNDVVNIYPLVDLPNLNNLYVDSGDLWTPGDNYPTAVAPVEANEQQLCGHDVYLVNEVYGFEEDVITAMFLPAFSAYEETLYYEMIWTDREDMFEAGRIYGIIKNSDGINLMEFMDLINDEEGLTEEERIYIRDKSKGVLTEDDIDILSDLYKKHKDKISMILPKPEPVNQ